MSFLPFTFAGVLFMTQAFDLSDTQKFEASGIPVVARTTDSYGEIISFQIVARGGITMTEQAGALEMLERSLPTGTLSFSKVEIDRIFASTGTQFSMQTRAEFIEVSVKCLRKFLPQILPVISEMMRVPQLADSEIELVRAQLMSELKSEEDHPDSILQLISHRDYFAGHPYFHRPQGYLDTVPKITRNDLVALLPRIFNKQNILFSFVSGLTPAEIEKLVAEYFLTLPSGTSADIYSTPPQPKQERIGFRKLESPTSYFLARFPAPSLMHEDFPALTMALQILDNRLFEEVRTKRALTYSVSSSMGNSLINSGVLYVSSTKLPEAVKVIMDEVEKMKTTLVSAEDVRIQINKYMSSWYLAREQALSQARIFSMYELIGGGWANAHSFISRLETVTPEAIQAAAKRYLTDFIAHSVGPMDPCSPGDAFLGLAFCPASKNRAPASKAIGSSRKKK